jgi:hypothetical protein
LLLALRCCQGAITGGVGVRGETDRRNPVCFQVRDCGAGAHANIMLSCAATLPDGECFTVISVIVIILFSTA